MILLRVVSCVVAVPAALLTTGAIALGHAEPERFAPAPGAVLNEAPQRVDGWFIQEIRRADETFIRVLDEAGQVVSQERLVDDSDRRHIYAELSAGLGPGRYLVAYQTYSDEDDEVSGGCFLFFVGQEAADAAHAGKEELSAADDCPVETEEEAATSALSQRVQQLETELAATGDSDDGVAIGATVAIAVGSGAAMLIVGGAIGLALRRRRR